MTPNVTPPALKTRQLEPLNLPGKIFIGVLLFVIFLIAWALICTGQQAGSEAVWFVLKLSAYAILGVLLLSSVLRNFIPVGGWVLLSLMVAGAWLFLVGSYNFIADALGLVVLFVCLLWVYPQGKQWLRHDFTALIERLLNFVFNLVMLLSALLPPNLMQRLSKFQTSSAASTPLLGTTYAKTPALKLVTSPEDLSLREMWLAVWNLPKEPDAERPSLDGWRGFLFFCIFLAAFWVVSSFISYLSVGPPVPTRPERFAELRERSPWRDVRVGLALSGGGYRAALMHAGVLDAFEKLGVPITHMTSVSGGSITGAFYAAGGEPRALRDAVQQGRFKLKRNLADAQHALFLPFPFQIPLTRVKLFPWYSYTRSDVQAALLDSVLLDEVKLSGLKRDTGAPRLMVCTTDLYSGSFLGLSDEGVLRRFLAQAKEKEAYVNVQAPREDEKSVFFTVAEEEFPRRERLSRVVAASGAFPGAFNAVTEEMYLDKPLEGAKKKPVLLADGGITDNSALSLLLSAHARLEDWKVDVTVSSDASALFTEQSDFTALGELGRAIDIVYANVGGRGMSRDLRSPQILLSPASFLDARLTDEEARRAQIQGMLDAGVSRLSPEALSVLVPDIADADRRKEAEALFATCCGNEIATRRIKEILAEDLRESVDAFLRASTLRDSFEGDDANKIFRLGQYLVALNWAYLREKLDAAKPAQDALPTPPVNAAP